jgi:hypothetical protein
MDGGFTSDGGTEGVPIAFKAEVMLAGWSESHDSGAKVTFWLPDASDLDVFRTMTVRKGRTAGQRFMCVLALIGEDEQPEPVDPPAPTPAPPLRWPASSARRAWRDLGPCAKQAIEWCGDQVFQEWIRPVYDRALGGDGSGWGDLSDADRAPMKPADFARHAVLVLCDCVHRIDLDTDPSAKERWHDLIRKPYVAYLRARSGHEA